MIIKNIVKLSNTYLCLHALQGNNISLPVEGGIISLKHKRRFYKINKRKQLEVELKETAINQETLHNFESELFKLILEIHNPEIPFTEKEVD